MASDDVLDREKVEEYVAALRVRYHGEVGPDEVRDALLAHDASLREQLASVRETLSRVGRALASCYPPEPRGRPEGEDQGDMEVMARLRERHLEGDRADMAPVCGFNSPGMTRPCQNRVPEEGQRCHLHHGKSARGPNQGDVQEHERRAREYGDKWQVWCGCGWEGREAGYDRYEHACAAYSNHKRSAVGERFV